jgi:probable rRNA maturation factor
MAQLKILIDNQQEARLPTPPIRKRTEQILNALGCDDHELSIVIMDDPGIRELNANFRKIDKPTNVLSFPMQEGEFTDITPGLLGDVVISLDTAEREAENAGISLEERMSQLLVHGILHLFGFDHEIDDHAADLMEKKSLELLRKIEKNTGLKAF